MGASAPGARKRGSLRRTIGRVIVNFLMIVFSVSCLYPVVWLFYASLNNKRDFTVNPVALPKAPNLDNYFAIFSQSDMGVWMLNTLRNTAVSLPLILLFGFVIGYLLSRFHFRGHTALYGYFLLGIVIPIHALMIPLYVQFKKCHILNRWFTLPVAYVAFGMPIVIFLVESYVHSIPVEMEEAATLDGSGFSRTLFSIILPICRPVLVTAGIIQFFTCWNEFSFALILVSKDTLVTLPVGMTLFKGQYSTDYPGMMAAMFLSILPAIILYLAFSKQIIKGMVTGAVKG
ncbi:MAG TPA: carbohydrate ABC transporter permease [Ruminococcaceae bacterium]|jgi:raffinose/stachyose/melibiose transport system permease protein|nr:carbohydrate ABC transporter permease [Oscillospiraceae bacterium]HBT91526.1 carbohydrate ABC transporter permease [Oscillospiraceae bacterium]HCB91990.1 carbohydrate ABC transporter permease [Oscillospiraceae bacterium]